jgi:hypothetical protein
MRLKIPPTYIIVTLTLITPLNLRDPLHNKKEYVRTIRGKNNNVEEQYSNVEDSHDLEKPNIDITASNERLKTGQILPNTTGLKITIQEEVISRPTSNYNSYILKDRTLVTTPAENVGRRYKPFEINWCMP